MRKVENTVKAIKRVIKFIEKNGYRAILSRKVEESLCDPNLKIVAVVDKGSELYKLYTLLHEAGHMKIFKISDYEESFGAIVEQWHKSEKKKTNIARYQQLKEEMLAWETGLNIAKELNIYIDHEDYDQYAARCFMSYVHQASRPYYQREVKKLLKELDLDIEFLN